MNVLILVLSARREPWGSLMDCSMATWDSVDHPKTRTLYYCGRTEDPNPKERSWIPSHMTSDDEGYYNVFYSPTLTEDLEHVSSRTIEAFEMALNYEWDYLARPNSSCYVHKHNLVDFLRTSIWGNVIFGVLTGGENSFLWGGCQYIFSRDVIERMVANKDKWNHKVMDDNSISLLAKEIGVPLASNGWCASINLQPSGEHLCLTYNHGEAFTFTDWEDVKKLNGHFFCRVKHDPDRTQDLMVMRKLYEHWK